MDFSATTGPISTKLSVGIDTLRQGTNPEKKSIEDRSAELLPLNRKCRFLGNRRTDFNQNWCVDGSAMYKSIFTKIKMIEVHSIELQALASLTGA